MYNNDTNNQIHLELSFSELEQVLPPNKIKNVTKSQLNLLKYFVENPNTVLYSMKDKQKLNQEEMENRYKPLYRLLEKQLLVESINIENNKIYKVSNIGIFYLIFEGQTFGIQTQKQLLTNYNYKDFIIFKLFVYPYISYDSILNIKDSTVFSNIFVYLQKCCKKVKDTSFYIDHTSTSYNGYMTNQLFVWNVPSIENPPFNSLRFFLSYFLGLSWVDKAEIKKDLEDKNIILIEHKFDKAIIRLLEDKSKAILTIKGKKVYEFIVRELIDDYSIESFRYTDNSHSSRVTVKEAHLKNLIMATQQDVQILIFSILLSYGVDMKHPLYDILKKDKIFMQSLEKTNHYFNQRCLDIIK